MIDKNSKAKTGTSRNDLNAKQDIVGICISIPGRKDGKNYASKVSIKMDNNIFNDEGDLDNKNED